MVCRSEHDEMIDNDVQYIIKKFRQKNACQQQEML